MDTIDYREDYYKGSMSRYYFESILNRIILYGNLDVEPGLILDYGCGLKHLKRLLKERTKNNKKTLGHGLKYIGYDIIPELTEIKDFTKLKPTRIVCSGVLEHISKKGIDKLMRTFKRMNPVAELFVFLPTENIFSKVAMIITGQTNAHSDHITKYKQANKIIEKHYDIKSRCYFMLRMAQITHYTPKT